MSSTVSSLPLGLFTWRCYVYKGEGQLGRPVCECGIQLMMVKRRNLRNVRNSQQRLTSHVRLSIRRKATQLVIGHSDWLGILRHARDCMDPILMQELVHKRVSCMLVGDNYAYKMILNHELCSYMCIIWRVWSDATMHMDAGLDTWMVREWTFDYNAQKA